MKKIIFVIAAVLLTASTGCSQKTLGGLLSKGSSTSTSSSSSSQSSGSNVLTNLLEGVFTTSNITVKDLVGEYQADGPAVCFKSDNLLKKAGGLAAASAVESKLSPYYKNYGLDNIKLVINEDNTFEMTVKGITLKGDIVQNSSEGTFLFKFKAFGSMQLASLTAYIQKSPSSIDLMFDATKLKDFIASVSKFFNSGIVSTLGDILGSYEGLCIGWKMQQTSKPASGSGSGLDALRGILGK